LITEVYAMGAPANRASDGGGLLSFLPIIVILLIMYLLLFRPQLKKQKAHQAMLNALKKGDRVVTAGGLHGTIVGIKENESIVVLKIADNVKVEVSKSSISAVTR